MLKFYVEYKFTISYIENHYLEKSIFLSGYRNTCWILHLEIKYFYQIPNIFKLFF